MNQTWVYIQPERGLYTVGFYNPQGAFNPVQDHGSRLEAEEHVSRLNGGFTCKGCQK